jgi:hypothetical protein
MGLNIPRSPDLEALNFFVTQRSRAPVHALTTLKAEDQHQNHTQTQTIEIKVDSELDDLRLRWAGTR